MEVVEEAVEEAVAPVGEALEEAAAAPEEAAKEAVEESPPPPPPQPEAVPPPEPVNLEKTRRQKPTLARLLGL